MKLSDRITELETRAQRAPPLDVAGARERLRALREAHAAGLPLPPRPPRSYTGEAQVAHDRLVAMLSRHASAQEIDHAPV